MKIKVYFTKDEMEAILSKEAIRQTSLTGKAKENAECEVKFDSHQEMIWVSGASITIKEKTNED